MDAEYANHEIKRMARQLLVSTSGFYKWRKTRDAELTPATTRRKDLDAMIGVHHKETKVPAMIPLVFANPFVTVKRVEQSLGLSNQGARKIVLRAAELGWIVETDRVGRGSAKVWLAEDVMTIVEAPLNTRA